MRIPSQYAVILYSEKRAARSQLDGPATARLIAAVSLCQMTNRVSVAITNLPGGEVA